MISSTTAMMPSSGGETLGIRHLSDSEVDAVNGGLIVEAVVGAGAAWFFDKYGSKIVSAGEDLWDWFTGLF